MLLKKNMNVQKKLCFFYREGEFYKRYKATKYKKTHDNYLLRLIPICKLSGVYKRVNKNTNLNRHFIRVKNNKKLLSAWTVQKW